MIEMYAYRRKGTARVAAPTMVTVATALLSTGAWAQQVPSGAGATPSVSTTALPGQPNPGAEVLTIPRVAERPLTADESPRIRVTAFQLSLGATRPSPEVNSVAVKAILDEAVRAQPEAGFTIADLEAVADKVTDYYRTSGLVVAKAFIPAQDVRGGIVTVHVLEGKLSAITVEGNKAYSTRTLLRPFETLLGAPVAKQDIESALLTLTNYPGLSAFGVLSAGQDVGTTKLSLRVQREDRAAFDLAVDNQGSRLSGENRVQAAMSVNNLVGQADMLRVYALYGFDPDDDTASGLYGGFQYSLPIIDSRNFLFFGVATNSYDIGNVEESVAVNKPRGDAIEAQLGYRYALAPTRAASSNFTVQLQSKQSNFESEGSTVFEDKLTILNTSFDWTRVDQRFRGVNQLSIGYSHGFEDFLGSLGDYTPDGGASQQDATGKFDKVTFSMARMQRLTKGTSLILNVRGQFSDDALLSLEQASLTGPDAVRAFRVTERAGTFASQNLDSALADTAIITTLEYIFSIPGFADRPAFGNRTWGQVLQFSLFADYAHGKLNDAASFEDAEFDVSGWGGSVQFNIPKRVFARVDVSKPFSNSNPDSEDVQAYFRLGVQF